MVAESHVEEAALGWLGSLGYTVLHGPEIATGEPAAERADPNYRDTILERRLRHTLTHLNPGLPEETIEDVPQAHTRRRPLPDRAQPRLSPIPRQWRAGRIPAHR